MDRSAPSASILQVFLVVGGSLDNQHEEVLSSTEILTEGAAAWLQARLEKEIHWGMWQTATPLRPQAKRPSRRGTRRR